MAAAKKGLKIREVSKDHFSSGVIKNSLRFSRLVIRLLEGKSLLASDVVTGKSDPICFIWCGPVNEHPDIGVLDKDENILRTKVCPTTVDPIWNEDTVFPLDITDNINELLELKCIIYLRDEDINDDVITYDELGMLEVLFKDILTNGKICKNSIVLSARWYPLLKTPGMRRVDGKIKITCSLFFGEDDNDNIRKQLMNNELFQQYCDMQNSLNDITSKSLPCQVQKLARYIVDPTGSKYRDCRSQSPSSRDRTPSPSRMRNGLSTTSLKSISSTTSNIAPLVKRPKTPPTNRRGRSRLGNATAPADYLAGERAYSYDDGIGVDFPIKEEPELESSLVQDDINQNIVAGGEEDLPDYDDIGDELLVLQNVRTGAVGAPSEIQMNQKDASKPLANDNAKHSGSKSSLNIVSRPTDDIHIAVNGTDITEILSKNDNNIPAEAQEKGSNNVLLEDVIKVGVDRITEEMGDNNPSDAEEFSEKFQGVAQKLSSSIDNNGENVLPKKDPSPSELLKLGPEMTADEGLNEGNTATEAKVNAAPESVPELKPSSEPANINNNSKDQVATVISPNIVPSVENANGNNADYEQEVANSSTAVAVVRALREMAQQRESMQQSLEAIARATESSFSKLSNRIARMETAINEASVPRIGQVGGGSDSYVGEKGIPFEEMFPDSEEDEADYDYSSANGHDGYENKKSSTVPLRKTSQKDNKRENNRSTGKRSNKGKSKHTQNRSSNLGKNSTAPEPATRKKNSYGSSDAIAKAKAIAAGQRRAQNANYNSPYGQGSGMDIQLVMKDASGNVVETKVDSPAGSPEVTSRHSLQDNSGSQSSEVVRNTEFNKSIPTSPIQSSLGFGMEGITNTVQMANQSPYPTSPMQGNSFIQTSLSRDFGAILDHGGLDDIGNMLNNTAPKPEELSAMVRNRLYDAIATLIHQRHPQHTERCLIWTLALIRGGSNKAEAEIQGSFNKYKSNSSGRLVHELAGHTKKDLKDALINLGQEPSKRGLLASLLKSQLK